MSENSVLDAIVRVEATPEIIPGRSGSKDGRNYVIPSKQVCWLHQGDKYPSRIDLVLREKEGVYKPGWYFLAGKCFTFGDFGRLKFSDRDVELISVEEVGASLAQKPAARIAA